MLEAERWGQPGDEPRAGGPFSALTFPPPPQIRIDKLVDKWSGSIEIGVTTHNPNNLEYPATMTNLQSGTGPWQGGGMASGGRGKGRLSPNQGVRLPQAPS